MRTKVLICAAVLAASLASSLAQNVYSINVVGYVNVTLPAHQFTCVANPLDASMGGTIANGNDMTNLFKAPNVTIGAGSYFNTFVPSKIDYSTTVPTYSTRTALLSANFAMPPGTAAMFFNGSSSDTVATFIGQVPQGTYNVASMASHTFNMLGSPIPIGGDTTNSTTVVGLAPNAGDSIATFNSAKIDWLPAVTWSTRTKTWSGPMPVNVGQGFLYFNGSASVNNWVSNFSVQ